MSIDWDIGKEARELDRKPFMERIKIEKSSIIKISVALIFYSLVMVLFCIFL